MSRSGRRRPASPLSSRSIRRRLRELLPARLRQSYHRWALRRDFGIEAASGRRRPLDRSLPRGVNLVGWLDSPTGVGESARALARAAEAAGVPVSRIDAASLDAGPPSRAPYGLNLFHVNADGAASVVELAGPKVHRGRANVGYWYWETEDFPSSWRDRFAYFDEIWVASEFCRNAIARVSPIPVAVVPPPVALSVRPRVSVASPPGAGGFRFLTICDAESVPERKNPLGVVRAFSRAFPAESGVSLTVKLSRAESAPDLLRSLESAGRGANVEIDTAPAGRAEVEELLTRCDAYVSLHRAEGFGFPIAEAMALGKPVAATDYSGSRDFVDEETGFPVRWRPFTLERTLGPYPAGTRWAEPEEEHAAETLQRIVSDRREAARRAEAGRRRISERYGLEEAGRRLAERLDRLTAMLVARP